MTDKDGRKIEYMRVSVTSGCNLSCKYCDPFTAMQEKVQLSPTQIADICNVATDFGVTRVRLTGGEPLIRNDFDEIVERIANIPKVEHIALTTNGILLNDKILSLPINSANISINATSASLYEKLCGAANIQTVLENARKAALKMQVKLNCVLLQDSYKEQAVQVIAFGEEIGASVRFIELMPMGNGAKLKGVLTHEIMAHLQGIYGSARPYDKRGKSTGKANCPSQANCSTQVNCSTQANCSTQVNCSAQGNCLAQGNCSAQANCSAKVNCSTQVKSSTQFNGEMPYKSYEQGKGPAKYYSFTGLSQPIGFISPMSACFCDDCNRIRLLASGHLQACLAKSEAIDLMPALQNHSLHQCFTRVISQKQGRHDLQNITLTALKEIGG